MKNCSSDHLNQTFLITNLGDLIQGFILNCRCEGKSPKTIDFYHQNLNRFLWYLHHRNLPKVPQEINADHVRQFLWYVASEPVRWGGHTPVARRPVSTTTVAHYYNCLRIFFSWLKREDFISENPIARISKPRKEQKVIRALSTEQIRALFKLCPSKTSTGARNLAIVMMLLDSGMRVSELANLQLDDIDPESGAILIRQAKGKKQRVVRIGSATQKAVWRYRTLHRKGDSDRLFLGIHGRPLDSDAIELIVRRLGKKAGILGVHAHRLRHTFAISFLRSGGDVFSLKYLLGHSSLTMVANYLSSLSSEDAIRAHKRFSPLDNVKF